MLKTQFLEKDPHFKFLLNQIEKWKFDQSIRPQKILYAQDTLQEKTFSTLAHSITQIREDTHFTQLHEQILQLFNWFNQTQQRFFKDQDRKQDRPFNDIMTSDRSDS